MKESAINIIHHHTEIINKIALFVHKEQFMTRRVQGTGSVYKKTDKQRNKPWVAYYPLGMTKRLTRKRILVGSYATKKEAINALDNYRLTHEPNDLQEITWRQAYEIIEKEEQFGNKPFTSAVKSTWRTHATPLLDKQISKTRTIHLQTLFNELSTRNLQGHLMVAIKRIYRFCMANDILTKDYSQYVDLKPLIKSTIHKPFTTEEMRILWKHSDKPFVKIVLIYIYTGMRASELAKMELENVHLNKRYMVGGSKTKAGKNRIIPIAKCIEPFIEYFYSISKLQRFKYLIKPNTAFHIYHSNNMLYAQNVVKKALPLIGIQNHKAHDTRHTFITLADNYNMNDVIKKLIIGHAQTDITKSIYTHKSIQQLTNAVDTLPYGTEMFNFISEKRVAKG